jgi:hypothetical protein
MNSSVDIQAVKFAAFSSCPPALGRRRSEQH